MPRTFTRTFRARHYECDAYGHLNNAVYLRYMQEAAFDATADAGYSFFRYMEMGVAWLARDTVIEYLRPVTYGESVDVTTYVADFSKVWSRRMYEMRLHGTDEMVAQGHTDWAYVDLTSGRPTSIPEDLAQKFLPEGRPEEPIKRERLIPAPPPPPEPFIMQRRVEWRDIDTMWHVNNANYFSYMQEASIQLAAHFGWPFTKMRDVYNLGVLFQRVHIAYETQAELDNELVITTYLSDVRRASGIRHFVISRADDSSTVCRARVRFAFVDIETGRPKRIPDDIMADFEAHIIP